MQNVILKTVIFLAVVTLRLGKAYGKNVVLLNVNLNSRKCRGPRTTIRLTLMRMIGPLSVVCGKRGLRRSGGEQSASQHENMPEEKKITAKTSQRLSKPSAQKEYPERGGKASIYS
jgi:hypothetical protein